VREKGIAEVSWRRRWRCNNSKSTTKGAPEDSTNPLHNRTHRFKHLHHVRVLGSRSQTRTYTIKYRTSPAITITLDIMKMSTSGGISHLWVWRSGNVLQLARLLQRTLTWTPQPGPTAPTKHGGKRASPHAGVVQAVVTQSLPTMAM
jgi:hypothetical protein